MVDGKLLANPPNVLAGGVVEPRGFCVKGLEVTEPKGELVVAGWDCCPNVKGDWVLKPPNIFKTDFWFDSDMCWLGTKTFASEKRINGVLGGLSWIHKNCKNGSELVLEQH